MLILGRLLALLSSGQTRGLLILRPFFISIASAMALIIITGVMVSALLLAALYALFLALQAYGFPLAATFITTSLTGILITLIIISIMAAVLKRQWRCTIQPVSPMSIYASEIADAFLDGLMTRPPAAAPCQPSEN